MVGVCIKRGVFCTLAATMWRVCGELAYPSESLESVENSEGNVVDLQTGMASTFVWLMSPHEECDGVQIALWASETRPRPLRGLGTRRALAGATEKSEGQTAVLLLAWPR